MSTYSQFIIKAKLPKVLWLCGSELILIEECIDRVKKVASPAKQNLMRCDATSFSLAELESYPFWEKDVRLIIVRDAQALDFKPFSSWLSILTEVSNLHLVFVSSESGPYKMNGSRFALDEANKKVYLPHVDLIRKSLTGELVVCSELSDVAPVNSHGHKLRQSDFVVWVKRQVLISDSDAQYLIDRCGHNLAIIKNVIEKFKIFGLQDQKLNYHLINSLCSEQADDDVVFCILAHDKRQAFRWLDNHPIPECALLLVRLENMLDVLARLHVATRQRKLARDIIIEDDIKGHTLKKYQPLAQHYTKSKIKHCQQVLLQIDELHRSGVKNPMAELIALW